VVGIYQVEKENVLNNKGVNKMNIENLLEKDVSTLKEKIDELKIENPDIRETVYKMNADREVQRQRDLLLEILDKLDALDRRLSNIFGDSILIDGQFKKIKL
jgi:hypothetical protein